MSQQELAEKIKAEKEVSSVNEWNDRIYVNLVGHDPPFKGCKNHKIWISSCGEVNFETGKGTVPTAFRESFDTIEEKYSN